MTTKKSASKVTKAEVNALSKAAIAKGTKAAHLAAAKAAGLYCDQIWARLEPQGIGYSRTAGYYSDLQSYHERAAKGDTKARPPAKYNPRNDPASMSFRGGTYYD